MNSNPTDLKRTVQSILEARYLRRIDRSGTKIFLGPETSENVAEHSFYASLWALVIHNLKPSLNLGKLLTICLIHDLEEVRVGDLNQVNKFYLEKEIEGKAFSDMWQGSELGTQLIAIHQDQLSQSSEESKYSYDCDCLAELVLEKEYSEKGNKEAEEWMEFTIQRIKTKEGKMLAKEVLNTNMSAWWEEIKNQIRARYKIPPKDYNRNKG